MKIPKHDRLWCKNLLKTGIFLGLLWTPLRPLNEQHMPLRTILLIPLFEHVGTRESSFLTVFSHCWYDYFFTSIQRTSPLLHMALSNFPCSKKPGCFYSKNMDSIEHVFSPKKTLHPFIPNIHKQKKTSYANLQHPKQKKIRPQKCRSSQGRCFIGPLVSYLSKMAPWLRWGWEIAPPAVIATSAKGHPKNNGLVMGILPWSALIQVYSNYSNLPRY